MASRYYLLLKGTRADSRVEVGKLKDEPGTSCARIKRSSQGPMGGVSEGYRGHLEGAPTGQIWNNLSMKKNNNIITNYNCCIEIKLDEKEEFTQSLSTSHTKYFLITKEERVTLL